MNLNEYLYSKGIGMSLMQYLDEKDPVFYSIRIEDTKDIIYSQSESGVTIAPGWDMETVYELGDRRIVRLYEYYNMIDIVIENVRCYYDI